MIFGIGVDIVDLERIKRAHQSLGNGFVEGVFTDEEIRNSKVVLNIYPYLGARFAAKEAFVKALGTGISSGIKWTDIEIKRKEGQRPFFAISGKAAEIMKEKKIKNVHLSLSHEKSAAIAHVVMEK